MPFYRWKSSLPRSFTHSLLITIYFSAVINLTSFFDSASNKAYIAVRAIIISIIRILAICWIKILSKEIIIVVPEAQRTAYCEYYLQICKWLFSIIKRLPEETPSNSPRHSVHSVRCVASSGPVIALWFLNMWNLYSCTDIMYTVQSTIYQYNGRVQYWSSWYYAF